MRKQIFALLACLLLTGCGGTGETAAPVAEMPAESLPKTAPVAPLSAPAIVMEGQMPVGDSDLPTEVVSLHSWQTSGEPLALLAEIPEQGIALYGVAGVDAPHVLFRWGDTLAEFPDWDIYTPKSVTPELLALDLDGDGAVEPAVSCFQGGTQVGLYALHVLRQSNGTLTDYQLPEALYESQLSDLLALGGSGETLSISLGDQSVRTALPEGVLAETVERLWTGASIFWQAEGGSLWLVDKFALPPEDAAEAGVASTEVLNAQASARVSFSDGQFTLSDFTLQSKLS